MKKLIITLCILFSFYGIAYGVNTTAIGDNCVTITGLDADWWATLSNLIYDLDVSMIVFYPSATNDRMIIHNGSLDADEFFDSGLCADTYDVRVLYYPPGYLVQPVIDISDCTLGTAANAKVKIYFR